MERIKQALEKARLERQQSGGTSASSPRVGSGAISGPVNYTHTRTVSVSKNILQDKRIIAGFEQNVFTDAYKILRTQVFQRLREKGWNSLAITSPGLNEGKTLTAINLAISLAMEVDYTVLLVDADLRHPSVHSYFGIEAKYGLSDYLTDDKPLSELLVHPEEIPYVNAALLVVEDGKTDAQDVKRAYDLLQGTNVIGTVLNKSWINVQRKDGPSWKWMVLLKNNAELLLAALKNGINRLRKKKSY
ncbi:MAG: CpsD/CapB family tyrosine-protein kinase [Proteobacteria bacterium]|nr:CpsD/CapB family tyrosine-protein kinase [Pseudomonadota bacterium]